MIAERRDLKKRAYEYALKLIEMLGSQSGDYISQVMGKQLLRSGTSVGANIVEAQAASSKRDFIQFYTHALKSANESKFWLSLIRETRKVAGVEELLRETVELSNILGACILTAKGKRKCAESI